MPAQPTGPYIHTLTTSFASTLDEIPQDMCRHFADLRELDAVLSQSLSGITKRIEELTERIEGGLASLESLDTNAASASDATAAEREAAKDEEVIGMFQLLHEIADDTSRIKLGGEDKIRVASLAAQHMTAYHQHLLTLVRRMHDTDAAYNLEILAPFTAYPHVPPAALVDPAPENRRGAPRRAVAVQNHPYGNPYAAAIAANQTSRNESTQRGVNGTNESPAKRRRMQGQSATGHNGQRGEGADTDDYSTPRRGPAALDAEAYRPGGNTASRARTQVRKAREGRTGSQQQGANDGPGPNPSIDGLAISRGGSANHLMQGVEPTVLHAQAPGPSHKSSTQNGRGRSSASHHHQSNPNPQPQSYPMPYGGYNGSGSGRGRNPYDGAPAGYDMASGYQQANMNPMMDAAYRDAMNINPNLNHPTYSHGGMGGSMGMLIPTQLPPPPGSSHNRPSSSSMSRNAYDGPPPGGSSVSRVDTMPSSSSMSGYGTATKSSGRNVESVPMRDPKEREMGRENGPAPGASASGGLMPLPMMTSLPPVTSFTQSGGLSMGNHSNSSAAETGHGRSRGYSHSHSGYGSYAAVDQPPSSGMGGSYNSHPMGYGQAPSSTPANIPPGYGVSSAPNEKGRQDVHPSLVNNSSKELPPISTHVRDPSVPTSGSAGPGTSAGSGSGTMHASLARDPPFRTNSAGSADRSERENKSSAPSRPRSGTASGGPTSYPTSGKYRDEVVERERNHSAGPEKESHGANSAYSSRHPSLHSATPSGAGQVHPSLSISSGQGNPRFVFGKDEPYGKVDDRERGEREYVGKRPAIFMDNALEHRDTRREREPEIEVRAVERSDYGSRGNGKVDMDVAMMDVDEKVSRAPVRRKNVEDAPYVQGQIPYNGVGDGEVIEGQIIDEDSKPYCICGQPSFGQMIGCDDPECEFEWFHIGCLGMSEAPQGEFFCTYCQQRRDKQQKKPGKRKGMSSGGRGRGA